jgi:anti-sigma28 factor (negative regulator of flagellin synthesis)
MSQSNHQPETRHGSQSQDQTTTPGKREKDFERVKKVVEQATDIREARVEAAKLALEKGKLNMKGNDLAEKILADPLNQADVEI